MGAITRKVEVHEDEAGFRGLSRVDPGATIKGLPAREGQEPIDLSGTAVQDRRAEADAASTEHAQHEDPTTRE